jgi:tetraacyldisaccharide 4'-kinase
VGRRPASPARPSARLSDGRAQIFEARARTTTVHLLHDDTSVEAPEKFSSDRPVAAFCATGNPRAFFAHLRGDGFALTHTRAFADHHVYTQAEVSALAREAEPAGARALLTTAKDAVKLRELRSALPIYVVEIEMEVADEGRLIELLREAAWGKRDEG